MVTPSRIDLTVSVSSLVVTQLMASEDALSHPFWCAILKVNPVSDSIKQCHVASKLGVAMIYVSGFCQS